MNCNDVANYVYVYLDGEFGEREIREFEAHVMGCGPCRDLVAFEERYLHGLHTQMDAPPAPESLRRRVLAAIAEEETSGWTWAQLFRGPGLERSLWFSGAFAAAFAMVFAWTGAFPAFEVSAPSIADRPARVIAAGVAPRAPVLRAMTPGVQGRGPNPAISLVSEDLVDNAVLVHHANAPMDVDGSMERVGHLLRRARFTDIQPPLVEGPQTRLLGARIQRGSLVDSVIYTYDHGGSRLTAIQSRVPRSWSRLGGFYSEVRRGDHKIVTWRESGLLTTVVTADPHLDPALLRVSNRSH